jgi:PD-(D/E)XK nuclease superfamily
VDPTAPKARFPVWVVSQAANILDPIFVSGIEFHLHALLGDAFTANTSTILFPTHLNKHAQCPERHHHEHREKRLETREFSPALARGIAIHAILAQAAEEYRSCGGVPANLHDLAEAKIPRRTYPDTAA